MRTLTIYHVLLVTHFLTSAVSAPTGYMPPVTVHLVNLSAAVSVLYGSDESWLPFKLTLECAIN